MMTVIVGVITLAAGLAMVLAHNIWSGGPLVVVVTLLGWMALIKSLFFLFLPHEMEAGLFLGQLHYRQLFYVYAAIFVWFSQFASIHKIRPQESGTCEISTHRGTLAWCLLFPTSR